MKKIITVLVAVVMVSTVKAQQDDKLSAGINYTYSIPLGDFKTNLANANSPRGFAVDMMYRVAPNWKIGAGVHWQDFFSKDARKLYALEDGSVLSGIMTNSTQNTSLLIKGMWLPQGNKQKALNPFLQIGAGANLITHQQLIGEFNLASDNLFKFAYMIGGGAMYDFGKQKKVTAIVSTQFNRMPLNAFGIKNMNNIGFSIGFRFKVSDQGGGNIFNGNHHRMRGNNFNRFNRSNRFGNW